MYSLLSRLTGSAAAATTTTTAASAAAGDAPTTTPAAAAASATPSLAPVQGAIRARRAVYPKDMLRGAVLPRDKLERALEAARWAPTHKLTQPWRFVVLHGASSKAEFEDLTIALVEKHTADPEKREATLKKMRRKKDNDWKNVGAYVAIVLRRTQGATAPPEWEEAASVAMATQNLWLAAWEEGIHGYWSSWQPPARDADEMKAFLGLDQQTDRVMGFFVCGVADPQRLGGYRGSRRPLGEVVEWRME